ncbi:MAG: ATP-binding protein [Betaproteobacteria bacterium]
MTSVTATFPARLSALSEMQKLIAKFCNSEALSGVDELRMVLIIEELFTNTVKHGHRGDCDEPVTIALTLLPGCVSMTYSDCAPPFDPIAAAHSADVEAGLIQGKEGGLGVVLAFTISHDARYQHVDGCNRVELKVAVRPDPP